MKTSCRGLSLTEMLVATTLLATATAGGLASLSRADGARRDAAQLQELHERAQYALASLEPELQMAGYFASDEAPHSVDGDLPESALRCGPGVIRRVDLAIEVHSTWSLPCTPQGGGQVPGTQVLVLRRASARPASGPEAGRAQWLANAMTGTGQLYWLGDAPWSPDAAVRGEDLRELVLRIFYVARNADGEPGLSALRVKNLTSIAGSPAFIDTEVMNGIEDLQVELLPAGDNPARVRVQIRVRAQGRPVRGTSAPQVLEASRVFTLRNGR